MNYKPTIGLEIHIELNTKSKMFCGCKNDPEEKQANFNVCPICMGHPGTLPVINEEAVKKVIKTGLALNCHIPEYSKFDRKNYFYPDLPKGYQISQLYEPLCKEGFLEIDGRKIRIREVHLEEDTGKLIHPEGADYSLVNYNRAGVPLMELATQPDMHSAEEAKKFAEELHLIMHYLNVSDADMEKGQMRVEVNISLSKDEKLGTKVEIKNLNSFRSVGRSIEYEIKRQAELLDDGEPARNATPARIATQSVAGGHSVAGGKIIQETRGWDDIEGLTFSQREKEEANDYRYFPEPDLPPMHFKKEDIDKIKAELPELPQQKRERFKREYELEEKAIEFFVYNKDFGGYFEKIISEFEPRQEHDRIMGLIRLTSNYLISDYQGLLKEGSHKDVKVDEGLTNELNPLSQKPIYQITPENFSNLIVLIYDGKISSKIAKIVLWEMFTTGADPSHIIEEKGLSQINDESEIEKIIEEVISQNPKVIEDYKKGKENAFQFLIGKTMAQSKGKANPQTVGDILRKKLS